MREFKHSINRAAIYTKASREQINKMHRLSRNLCFRSELKLVDIGINIELMAKKGCKTDDIFEYLDNLEKCYCI